MNTYNDVDWHGGGKGSAENYADGPAMGDIIPCPVQGCKATFDNHPALIAHMIARHPFGKRAELVNVKRDGFDLDLLPWEDAQDVIDQAEAILDEMDYKPGLGIDDPFDEIEFMGAELTSLRLGLAAPVQRLISAQMDEIERERVGADFCQRPYLW